jgi:hypothetical protein
MNTDKHGFNKINLCANAPGTYWFLRCFLGSPKSSASALFQVAAFGAMAFDFGLPKKQTARSATLRVQKPICSGRVCPRSSVS